ncbi:MAG: alpha/beta fold hydrolase [Geminicoccaceae bacterium]|nr:alpha/beta fold hydrolase [Geminicoccaceae bacterium]
MNIVLGGLAAWGLVAGGLYLFQDRLIFPRHATGEAEHPLPDGSEKLRLDTADGHVIHGHFIRARRPGRGLLLGFTGNAWNARDCFTFLARRIDDFDIAVFHYRGYAPSEGEPGQQALFEDAVLIHDTLVKGLSPHRVYTVGFSLGSGVAAWLASQRPIAGQILVTPFDSIEAIARRRYRIVPVSVLLRHPFRSIDHLRDVDIPTAVIAAGQDTVVPPVRTETLVRSLRHLAMYKVVPDTSHSGIYDLDIITDLLHDALDAVEGGASSGTGGTRSQEPEPSPVRVHR